MCPAPADLVSIAIPCYEMHGRGAELLDWSLAQVELQTYPSIEVVVSDHSIDDAVRDVCSGWDQRLNIRYLRNPEMRGSSSANANVAIVNSEGALIKILCQDDYLAAPDAIERTVEGFAGSPALWLASSYWRTHHHSRRGSRHDPRLNAELATVNTVGTHSGLTIRREASSELFDENLIWFMDCEYYRRLYESFGRPILLYEPTVTQFLWQGQVTHTHAASEDLREAERQYVLQRHPIPLAGLPLVSGRRSLLGRLALRWPR
jgi:glycosyltransferase involved in cell wall biosynthesis